MEQFIRMATVLVLAAMLTVGCSDSPEHKLLLATQMMKQNQPNKALELVDAVLEAEITSENAQQMKEQARVIKAQALLATGDLDGSRKVLNELKKEKPNDPEPVRQVIYWALRACETALNKSDFTTEGATGIKMLADFKDNLGLGIDSCRDLTEKHKLLVEGEFLRAELLRADVRHHKLMLDRVKEKARRDALREGQDADVEPREVTELRKAMDARSRDIELAFLNVLSYQMEQKEPLHEQAATGYFQMVTAPDREGWNEAWQLASRLSDRPGLAAPIAQAAVVAVLHIPDAVVKTPERLKIAERLLEVVPEAQHATSHWLLARARVYLSQNDADRAQAAVEKVETQDRMMDMESKFLLSWCLVQRKRFERARPILDRLSVDAGGSPQVLWLHAEVLKQMKEYALAEEQAKKALSLDRNFTPARVLLADLLALRENPDAGKSVLDSTDIRDVNPDDPTANRMRMSQLIAANDRATLEIQMQKMEKFLPLKDEHVAMLIDGFSFLKRSDKTLFYANMLKARRPEKLEVQLKYAEALLAQGDPDRVVNFLEGVRPRFPDMESNEQIMAQLYAQLTEWTKAHEWAAKAVAKNPTDIDVRLLLSRTLVGMDRIDEAKVELEQALTIDPKNRAAHELKARIHLFEGQTDDAGKHIAQIDESEVDENVNPVLKAQILIQRDKLTEAKNVCNIAVARGHPDPVLHLLLARIYILEKKPKEAERSLVALARQQPKNTQVYKLLAEFYEQTKELHNSGLLTLKSLQQVNDPLARMGIAQIYNAQGKYDEASAVINELFPTLLKAKDASAFELATTLARIALNQKKDVEQAMQPFRQLEEAGIMVNESRLRQIDLTGTSISVHNMTQSLSALAKNLKRQDEGLRAQVLARMNKLNKQDVALVTLDQWLADEKDNTTLLRWKGEILAQTGKYADAVASYRSAIALDPKNVALRSRLVQVQLNNFDFPAAQEELMEVAKLGAKSKALALAEIGQVYVRLGLNRQAARTFDELSKIAPTTEPNLMFAMGRVYNEIGDKERALDRLSKVPSYARLYPAAQVEMCRLQARSNDNDGARQRVAAMVLDGRMLARALTELLTLNPYDREQGERDTLILGWADDVLRTKDTQFALMPKELQSRWMGVRVMLMDRTAKTKKEYEDLLKTLETWQQLETNSLRVLKGRLAVMALLNMQTRASDLFASYPALAKSSEGPLLSVVVGRHPERVDNFRAPLSEYFVALATGNVEAAKTAAGALETRTAIYKKDLLSIINNKDINDTLMRAAARQMAAAQVAMEAGLHRLSASLTRNLIDNRPDLAPAHSLHAQALFNQGQPLADALAKAKASIPNAGVTHYLNAELMIEANDYKAAIESLSKLLQAEPENEHAQYRLAQVYQLANESERSIQILEKMHAVGGNYRVLVSNDLAYLLATKSPDRLKEAVGIAARAAELTAQGSGGVLGAAALKDTVGWIEHLSGNDQAAIASLSRAVPVLNYRAEVHYHIGVVYDKLGKKEWARYHLDEAAAGDPKLPEVAKAKELLAKSGG